MLVYVHVPYCRRKCGYCSFHSWGEGGEVPQEYVEGVKREIEVRVKELGDKRVGSLYFGGGTPSLLRVGQVAEIIGELRRVLDLGPEAEITCEANPESAGREWLEGVRALGVNRLSLGLQSLDERMLEFLGRPHGLEEAWTAYTNARAAGFANISLDLIWGLPGRTLEAEMRELDALAAWGPEHISRYCLSLDQTTPLAARLDRGEFTLPDEDTLSASFLAGSERLESLGYTHYEVSNFARPGHESRHNQGYWQGLDYLGLGPAAVSTLAGVRRANPRSLTGWLRLSVLPDACWRSDAVGADLLEDITPDLARQERVMLALRTSSGLPLADLSAPGQRLAQELPGQGLAVIDSTARLHLTRQGLLLADEICERLTSA